MKFFINLNEAFISGGLGLALSGAVFAVPQGLVESLGDEDFQRREAAQKELSTWTKGRGKETFNKLKELKQSSNSPEVKMRLETVLDEMVIPEPIAGTRGFIGISMDPMLGSVRVRSVHPGTPAEKKGLKVGDEIIGLDGKDLTLLNTEIMEASEFLGNYVKNKNAGDKLDLKVRRGEQVLEIKLKLGDYDQLMGQINPMQNRVFPPGAQLKQFRQMQVQPNLPQLNIMPNAGLEGMKLQLDFGDGEQLEMLLEQQDKIVKELQKKLNEQRNRDLDGAKLLRENFEKDLLKMAQEQGGNDKKRADELLQQLKGKGQPELPEKPHAED